jgi:hypothetical protein
MNRRSIVKLPITLLAGFSLLPARALARNETEKEKQ